MFFNVNTLSSLQIYFIDVASGLLFSDISENKHL